MTKALRVAVVDDHPMVLRGTCEMIEEADDLEVVARGRNGDEAIAIASGEAVPDVLVLDVHMPGKDGVAVVSALRAQGAKLGLLMLTSADDETTVWRALKAGADGYVLKTADEGELHRAVRLAAARLPAIVQPEVGAAMRQAMQGAAESEPLSEREVEILRTLAQDLSNKEIANRLGISDRTVQQHLANIFGKLGVASRTGAILKALRLGVIQLSEARA